MKQTINKEERQKMEQLGYCLITPELANKWLTKNNRNRKLRSQFVDDLVTKIKSGQWQPNTLDSIGFFDDGTLANGQHRLTAIAKANIPVYAKVEFNIPKSVAICIDSGRSRSASDGVQIVLGKSFYTKKISSMISLVTVNGARLSHENHLKIAEKYEEPIIKVKSMFEGLPNYLSSTIIMASVFLALMNGVDYETLVKFVLTLGSNRAKEDIDEGILLFKDKLQYEYFNKHDKRRNDYSYGIKRCQNVIFNFARGRKMSKFPAPESYRYPLIKFDLTD